MSNYKVQTRNYRKNKFFNPKLLSINTTFMIFYTNISTIDTQWPNLVCECGKNVAGGFNFLKK
jgi:hypothetical protein